MSKLATPIDTGTRWPVAVAFAPLALCIAGVAVGSIAADQVHVEDIVDAIGLAGFPLVGGLLLMRGRVPVLGWLFGGIGILLGAAHLTGAFADSDLPGAPVGSLLGDLAFVALIQTVLTVLPLLFPTGHLPSRRWRPIAWAVGLLYPLSATPVLFMPGAVDEDDPNGPTNPIGIPGAGNALEAIELASLLAFAVLALVCTGSLLLRLRGAPPETRRQVAILGAGVGALAVLFAIDSTLQDIFGDVYGIGSAIIATSAVPVAAGIALLRDN